MARWLFAGHAAREPEALRDLFAVQAEELGVSRFMLTVPATDPALIDVWFRLAFGCQAVWAVREVDAGRAGRLRRDDPAGDARRPGGDRRLRRAPLRPPGGVAELLGVPAAAARGAARRSGETSGTTSTYVPFVAERDGRIVGRLLTSTAGPRATCACPPHNIDLAFAATRDGGARAAAQDSRSRRTRMRWAHEQGFRSMTVDWRSVNLLSSRFWPRRGFRPQYLRLYRAVP